MYPHKKRNAEQDKVQEERLSDAGTEISYLNRKKLKVVIMSLFFQQVLQDFIGTSKVQKN